MSEWYDPRIERYRTSLVYKIFYQWGWPAIRRAIYRLPTITAHRVGIRGIQIVGKIEVAWEHVVTVAIFALILALRLRAFLPSFRWRKS